MARLPRARLNAHLAACLLALPLWLGAAFVLAQSEPAGVTAGVEPITPVPAPPRLDAGRLSLGDRLFHDPQLSHNNATSCETCHDLRSNGATTQARDPGPDGKPLNVHTPTVFNAALSFRLNWVGNARTLEEQAAQSLSDSMGSSVEEAVGKVRAQPELAAMFRDAYGREPDGKGLLDAIATYEQSLLTPDCRFDRWLAGDPNAISRAEFEGYELFKSLGCISCHQGVNVGGNMFQRHGIFHPLASPEPKIVRVPGLRNVAATPPYFHDGSAATLEGAVRAMGFAQLDRVLTDEQVAAIVAFLNTLTGDYNGHRVAAVPNTSGSGAPQ